jgi:hypothetical protein
MFSGSNIGQWAHGLTATQLAASVKAPTVRIAPPSLKSLAMLRFGRDNGISSTCRPRPLKSQMRKVYHAPA